MRKVMLTSIVFFLIGSTIVSASGRTIDDSAFYAIYMDEKYVELDPSPINVDNRVLVPIRAVSALLNVNVDWHQATKTVTLTKGSVINTMVIDEATAFRREGSGKREEVRMDVPPTLYKGITYVPLRYVSESLNAHIEWKANRTGSGGSIYITTPKSLTLKEVTVTLGDSLDKVKEQLGEPNRIDESVYNFQWYVYNSDYTSFLLVGIDKSNTVRGFYTNAKGFIYNDGEVRYGATGINPLSGVRLLQDKYEDNKVHGIMVTTGPAEQKRLINDLKVRRANELENWDATNVFRVNYGLKPLRYDETAAITARNHSQDMADQNYFEHTGLDGRTPWDRYRDNNGLYVGSGENIAAGYFTGIDSFNGWVNSEGHRYNMLSESHTHIGVGMGYNVHSGYGYYYTQFFSNEL